MRLIRNERNYGLGLSRNLGMKAARGKYIYFFDSDDAIVPGALELLVQAIEETGADIVHSSVYYDPKNHEFKTGISTDVECKDELTELEGFLPQDLEERLMKTYVDRTFRVYIYPYFQQFPDLTEEQAREMMAALLGSARQDN